VSPSLLLTQLTRSEECDGSPFQDWFVNDHDNSIKPASREFRGLCLTAEGEFTQTSSRLTLDDQLRNGGKLTLDKCKENECGQHWEFTEWSTIKIKEKSESRASLLVTDLQTSVSTSLTATARLASVSRSGSAPATTRTRSGPCGERILSRKNPLSFPSK
jgi:hypothetical protein